MKKMAIFLGPYRPSLAPSQTYTIGWTKSSNKLFFESATETHLSLHMTGESFYRWLTDIIYLE